MDIKINEFKKVITSPVIIFLIIVFNLFIIYNNSEGREGLKVTNNIVSKFGYKIDDNMIRNLKTYYDSQLKEINMYKLTGKAATTVRGEYKKFDKRFRELVKMGEHKNIFFLNEICEKVYNKKLEEVNKYIKDNKEFIDKSDEYVFNNKLVGIVFMISHLKSI